MGKILSLIHIYTFIRHDWLEALGLEEPTNQQEMVDAMIAFATQDPDGNGVDDTYGLALVRELWGAQYGLEGFFNAYHAYPNIWYEDEEGNLVYGTVQAEPMKAALADLQKLYAAGAIDPEFIVKDSAKAVSYTHLDVYKRQLSVRRDRRAGHGDYDR